MSTQKSNLYEHYTSSLPFKPLALLGIGILNWLHSFSEDFIECLKN